MPGRRLRSAVGFAGGSLPSYDGALWALRTWLDSWTGIGHVAVGCTVRAPTCSSLSMTTGARRSTRSALEHSPTSVTGTAWEHTSWHALQRAAWDALRCGIGS